MNFAEIVWMMSFAPIDILFNIVVLFFWFRMWNREERDIPLNPYLSKLVTFTQPVIDLFRAMFGKAPASWAATAALLFLILFRGLALPALNPESAREAWVLKMGFSSVSPAMHSGRNALFYVMFSGLSFAIFLFQVWGLAMLFVGTRRDIQTGHHPAETLYFVARPFADIRMLFRPWILLVYGVGLACAVHMAGMGWMTFHSGSPAGLAWIIVRYAIIAGSGAVDLLLVLRFLIIILIIGSWIVMFTGNEALMILCREWLDFLLGPFRRYPVRIGPLDITPIVAFLALDILHWLLNGVLLRFIYIMVAGTGGGG